MDKLRFLIKHKREECTPRLGATRLNPSTGLHLKGRSGPTVPPSSPAWEPGAWGLPLRPGAGCPPPLALSTDKAEHLPTPTATRTSSIKERLSLG